MSGLPGAQAALPGRDTNNNKNNLKISARPLDGHKTRAILQGGDRKIAGGSAEVMSSAVPQFRSSAVPQFRSSAVPQFRSSAVPQLRLESRSVAFGAYRGAQTGSSARSAPTNAPQEEKR